MICEWPPPRPGKGRGSPRVEASGGGDQPGAGVQVVDKVTRRGCIILYYSHAYT